MRNRRRSRRRPPGVDLTPLLDTVFLLIVILMCTLIHMRVVDVIGVSRPVVTSGSSVPNERHVLQIVVRENGEIALAGSECTLDGLLAQLASREAASDACLISADRQARHGRVAQVAVAARQAFASKPVYFEVQRSPDATQTGAPR